MFNVNITNAFNERFKKMLRYICSRFKILLSYSYKKIFRWYIQQNKNDKILLQLKRNKKENETECFSNNTWEISYKESKDFFKVCFKFEVTTKMLRYKLLQTLSRV